MLYHLIIDRINYLRRNIYLLGQDSGGQHFPLWVNPGRPCSSSIQSLSQHIIETHQAIEFVPLNFSLAQITEPLPDNSFTKVGFQEFIDLPAPCQNTQIGVVSFIA